MSRKDMDVTPLTPEELTALRHFLRQHDPAMSGDIEYLVRRGLVPRLPLLLRMLWEEKQRFEAGEDTRYVDFIRGGYSA